MLPQQSTRKLFMKRREKGLNISKYLDWTKKLQKPRLLHNGFHATVGAILLSCLQLAYGGDGAATAAIEAGPLNSVVVKNDGTVWAWGRNAYGESGNALIGSTAVTNPVLTSLTLTNAVAVASGGMDSLQYYAHTLVLRSDGLILSSGTNNFGQLGDGTTVTRTNFVVVTNLANIVAIAAGSYHSLALRADGTVWGWGNNTSGQIGNGTNISPQLTPVQATNLVDVVAISAGQYHSLALKADGTVWAWGTNNCGQLGDNTITNRLNPVMATNLNGVVAISAGANYSLALKGDGTVWAWGTNNVGQIGISNTLLRLA